MDTYYSPDKWRPLPSGEEELQAHLEPAILLTAAATTLRRQAGIRASPTEDILRERWLEPTRGALAARADIVWAEGLALSPRQAIDAALSLARPS